MDVTRPDRTVLVTTGLALSTVVFAWPQLSLLVPGTRAWYPLVTVVFTALILAVVAAWPRGPDAPWPNRVSMTPAAWGVALVAIAIVGIALYRWLLLLAWRPYEADMLIVIREATRRLQNGHTPYATYRAYDAPWNMVMPYGPALWGPFFVAQWLRLDLRFVTIFGELFVPAWCGVAAVVEAARGHIAGAASWLFVLGALVLAFDIQGYTLLGHTPAYWPLLPLFAVAVSRRRWIAAACLLALLVVARSTMVALVPILLMAVWNDDRRTLPGVLLLLTAIVAVAFAPFVAWDASAVWGNMVVSYPRVMKESVWPVLARRGIETIGLTEWLLEQHREWLVVPAQVMAMLGLYGVAWPAIRRGAAPLAWMALALFAFSMTSLYPVHYLYYDVLLLLVSGALAGTLRAGAVRMTVTPWLVSQVVLATVMFAMTRAMLSAFPHVAAGDLDSGRALRGRFAESERDGAHRFSWIIGGEATIVLPRSSAAAADVVISAQSPMSAGDAPQQVTAILNGTLLSQQTVAAGWQEIRFAAPRRDWWVGFNQLQLVFASTMTPRDAGGSDDPRPLALGFSRVDVTPGK